ncbi:hypothetical protein AXF42_Ash019724 [Apostasia shenzhenica]|uniref:HMA domain-containing protein n=1 Tax=Apostasia shenzhenica TaxID=1088818 RepID=A0A2H9ZRP5_9ASPA|nr:hypothetical protein AXF42_Ash019724 [Apostasia shenzhenica]
MIAMDMKEKKLTVIGTVDPVNLIQKLRKVWHTEILSIGPAKEPEKKEEGKKEEEATKAEEPKKGEEPKEEAKKEEPRKEEAEKKKKEEEEPSKKVELPSPHEQMMMELVKAYRAYSTQMNTHYYAHAHSAEENPNSCVIC